jgi:FMN phosphatase YigB (HAD superfamily)
VTVVFDMDNTLVDELGAGVRPGMRELLEALGREGHVLVLWTSSRRERAVDILREHDLRRHFRRCLFREDYDPEDKGLPKDIRKVGGDVLVDDDPALIDYVRSVGRRGVLVAPYRKGAAVKPGEAEGIRRDIGRGKRPFGGLFGGKGGTR